MSATRWAVVAVFILGTVPWAGETGAAEHVRPPETPAAVAAAPAEVCQPPCRDWIDHWGAVGNLGLIVSLFLAGIAVKSLGQTVRQRQSAALSNLIQWWDNEYLTPAKDVFFPEMHRFDSQWEADNGDALAAAASDPERRRALWAQWVADCRAHFRAFYGERLAIAHPERQDYVVILRMADFFENIGVLLDKGLLPPREVMALFGEHIRDFDRVFAGVVLDMQADQRRRYGENPGEGSKYGAILALGRRANAGLRIETPRRRPD